jgi:hypothetical protein
MTPRWLFNTERHPFLKCLQLVNSQQLYRVTVLLIGISVSSRPRQLALFMMPG